MLDSGYNFGVLFFYFVGNIKLSPEYLIYNVCANYPQNRETEKMVVTSETLAEVGTICPKWRTTSKFHLSFPFSGFPITSCLPAIKGRSPKCQKPLYFDAQFLLANLQLHTRGKCIASTLKRKNYFTLTKDLVWGSNETVMSVVG